MHLSSILQCNARTGCMAPPAIKPFVNLGISVVAFDKEFRLLEVSKGLERKVGGLGIIEREWVFQAFGTPRESRDFPGWHYFRWQFSVGVVNNESFPKFERPRSWILSDTLDSSVQFIQIYPI